MKKAFIIVIGFIHDFAAGCWAATVLAIYWLERLTIEHPELQSALVHLKQEFFYLGIACVAIVFMTGMGRTFTYIGNLYGEDAEKTRRRMLIIKHIVMLVVFGLGLYWQYLMAYAR